jgi:hypothetical protein
MATTTKDNAQIPMDLAVKLYKECLAAGDPVSFRACATKFGVNQETLRQHVESKKTPKKANSSMSWFTPE